LAVKSCRRKTYSGTLLGLGRKILLEIDLLARLFGLSPIEQRRHDRARRVKGCFGGSWGSFHPLLCLQNPHMIGFIRDGVAKFLYSLEFAGKGL
jgi:hypothetical protein